MADLGRVEQRRVEGRLHLQDMSGSLSNWASARGPHVPRAPGPVNPIITAWLYHQDHRENPQ